MLDAVSGVRQEGCPNHLESIFLEVDYGQGPEPLGDLEVDYGQGPEPLGDYLKHLGCYESGFQFGLQPLWEF